MGDSKIGDPTGGPAPQRGIERLLEIMARLREPEQGCPWDREQTFETIAPYTIEEAYEVADAIARGDWAELQDELGDLLFQVVFHAQMAREAGLFSFEDAVRSIVDKMVRRHPHVFGDARVDSAQAQTAEWEAHKAAERAAAGRAAGSVMDGVAHGLPAFRRALKVQKKAARVGFDWPAANDILHKLAEEIGEIQGEIEQAITRTVGKDADESGRTARVAEEIGDLLFTCVNLWRRLEVDPELALRRATIKFEQRFRRMETGLAEEGLRLEELDLEALEARWQRAKEGDS